jgi:hypothetical protein
MADDIPTTPGSGANVATDDIGGRHFQRFKLVIGADGVNEGDIASANPLPTDQARVASGSYGAVNVLVTATEIRAATAARKSLVIVNAGSAYVYVGLDGSVTTANGIPLAPQGGSVEFVNYTGAVNGISASGTQSVRFMEF